MSLALGNGASMYCKPHAAGLEGRDRPTRSDLAFALRGLFAHDKEVPAGTTVKFRAAEAPGNVPAIEAEVRHCRKVGKGFLFGLQFNDEIPWNVRVWFG